MIGLVIAACLGGTPAADPAAASTAAASTAAAPAPGPFAQPPSGCDSVTTCFTPQQMEVAYGIWPLLYRGIQGSGETVVLPEPAESQAIPPTVTDIRRDLAGFDLRFGLPA